MHNIFFLKHNVGFQTLKQFIINKIKVNLVVINKKYQKNKWFKDIVFICKKNDLTLHITKNINEDKIFLKKMRNFKKCYGFSVYYTEIFKKNFLDFFEGGIINFHQSLLPKYRGLMPIQWAIISGEATTGITAHFINEKIDSGNIILKKKIKILKTDSAHTVSNKIMKATPKIVLKVYKLIYSKKLNKDKLKKMYSDIYYPRRNENLDKINISMPLDKIYDFVRGLSFKRPFAWIHINKKKIFIKNSLFVKKLKRQNYAEGLNLINNRIILKKDSKLLELKKFI
jgi:methionyl-tRNA formyltransferase